MNAAQARAVVALFERAAEQTRRPLDELHLGLGHEVVTIEVRDDDEIEEIVNEDGWQAVTVWRGGVGCCLLLDNDGDVYGDDDATPVPARLELAKNGQFTWVDVAASQENGGAR